MEASLIRVHGVDRLCLCPSWGVIVCRECLFTWGGTPRHIVICGFGTSVGRDIVAQGNSHPINNPPMINLKSHDQWPSNPLPP
ncbi:hypothetical protein VTJ04DRAFT_7407 [Mycothermus thermophilus]|uniref:uncharacterized protein n=1 Tax=Humicola insolens TaxID=85995 RepID=UPI0037425886